MQRAWQGPNLQHLVERWRRVEHDLTRIAADFDQQSRRLHDNADLQHRSSGTSAGGGVSHHGGGGVVPTAGGHPGGHGGRPTAGRPTLDTAPVAASSELLVGWGPDGGRPLVTPGVPQPLHGMGWGHWIGSAHPASATSAPADGTHGPFRPADVAAAAAQALGLPIR